MKNLIIALVCLSFISCDRFDLEDENIFEFNLQNSYRIEQTNLKVETPNAYELQNIPEFNVLITDSEIGDELTRPCCQTPWDYIINPTTEVKIAFTERKNELRSGVYTYDQELEQNDFIISINNEMIFDSNNNLSSLNRLADPYREGIEMGISNAQVELVLGEIIFELNYIIELFDGNRIVGSYSGDLNSFTYNVCEADCD